MKANELMQGDYITFKDSVKTDETPLPVKVIGIGYVGRGIENEALVEIDGDKTCDIIEINDECVGIPLTPEILERNGWRSKINGRGEFYLKKPLVDAAIVTKTITGFQMNHGPFLGLSIHYVHELQHALRLCGIEKEITI